MAGGWVVPDEPDEAQPPVGVRLDDVYVYQGQLQSAGGSISMGTLDNGVEVTYIDEVEDEDWGLEVGPVPETTVVG